MRLVSRSRKKKRVGRVFCAVTNFSDVFGTASLNSSKITLGVILSGRTGIGFDVCRKRTNLPAGELSIEKSRKTLERIVIEFAEQGWSLAFKGVAPLVSA